MRISKNDGSQSLDLQRDALIQFGIDPQRIYQDLITGAHNNRDGLQNCLKSLQPDNTLVVWKLDRLGRNLKDLVTIIDDLRKKKIGFKVLTGSGAQIDTTTPNGRLCFGLFATLAEYERELIIERTKAGLAAARARGRNGGRPRKMDLATLKIAMAAMTDRNSVAKDVAKKLNMTTTTLYDYVNPDGTPKKKATKILSSQKS